MAVATAASKLKRDLFGDDFRPGKTVARVLFQRIGEAEAALTRDPSLRKSLEGMVPAVMVEEMLVSYRQLGDQLMRRGRGDRPARSVDLRIIGTALRQRMTEYVVNVLATVNASDPETVARAQNLLDPLTELRAELVTRRSRRAKEVEAAPGASSEASGAEEEIEAADEAEEIETDAPLEEEEVETPADPAPS